MRSSDAVLNDEDINVVNEVDLSDFNRIQTLCHVIIAQGTLENNLSLSRHPLTDMAANKYNV